MFASLVTRASARALRAFLFAAALFVALSPRVALAHSGHHNQCDDGLFDDGSDESSRYHVTGVAIDDVAGLRRRTFTIQDGPNPVNRFFMHRVSRPFPHLLRGVILLLPPLASGFQNYEVGEDGNYLESFAGYFASRGYDVWGYSQRVQGLAPGSCESGAVSCSAVANWGMATIVDDVSFIRRRIARARPFARVAVGGLSLGSMSALAVVNARPHDYAGLILLDGTLYDTNPAVRAINQGYCADFDALLGQGVIYDGQQLPGIKAAAALASVDPDGPSPFPGFAPGYTNHQVFVSLVSAPPPSPTTPRPGYFLVAGDAETDAFTFANDAVFRANVLEFVDYVALRTLRDVNCSLAGDRTWTNHLGAFRGEIFVAAGGHGFGQAMLDTLALMPKAHATVSFIEAFGHVDHFFAENRRELTEGPIREWLEDYVFDHH